MRMKFNSDVKSMKPYRLTEPDFRYCGFKTSTEVKMTLSGIWTLSAADRGLDSGPEMFRYTKFPTLLRTHESLLLSHLFFVRFISASDAPSRFRSHIRDYSEDCVANIPVKR